MNTKQEDRIGRRLKEISGDIRLYVEKRIELLLLNIGEHFSSVVAESIHRTAGLTLVGGGVLFLLVALAIYLGQLLGSPSLGYILVSLPLLIAGLLFVYLRPKSMLSAIKHYFEKEFIKAISLDGKEKPEQLNLPEHKEEQSSPKGE